MHNHTKKFIGVVTLFPSAYSALDSYGVIGKALKEIDFECFDPRDYVTDNYRKIDDAPYGGGQGMLIQYSPIASALDDAIARAKKLDHDRPMIIYFSPQGRRLQQNDLNHYADANSLILLSGAYEGIDQRIIDAYVDREISIGDYVLSSGDLPAMVFINAMARLWDNALGSPLSAKLDSFTDDLLEEPQYTRPSKLTDLGKFPKTTDIASKVPEVLQKGDHAKIAKWKKAQALRRTWQKRPDLMAKKELSLEEKKLFLSSSSDRGKD